MAKLNKKKTSKDILANITKETKNKVMLVSSSSGKIFIYKKPKKRLTIKDMRNVH